ncbi:YceI family protein [Pontibacter arcticus]|uniref:Lipid/polyisoprenoid-binding YceI-like domain-containing protein n=1 Tax=Pontibacter arcticus TaxID=2080288 RepID=A0A364RCQ6_9BACT|nr:YceI family protein [Pontibacter arcticus]RAU82140.1 hypothetical protein DP923_10035 [Pontibacter arcticus]
MVLLLTRIFLVAAAVAGTAFMPGEAFVIVKGNKITVQAHTSLGAVNCTYTGYNQKNTVYLNRQHPKKDRLKLTISVAKFNCGNYLLNRDFANTLNVKQHPEIRIELISLKKHGNDYTGELQLELAGKNILLNDVKFYTLSENQTELLKSNICLDFSEIGLVTPKKLGGLFKVQDELQITVELALESDNLADR